MRIALYSGMRKGEILNLKWQDINILRGLITIKNPKSGKDKTIPLNTKTKAVLEEINITARCAYVFPGKNGERRTNITRSARRIMNSAGIPDTIRPLHSLRHTFASKLVSAGVDIYVVRDLLTHSNVAVTQRYAHLSDQALKAGSEQIIQALRIA
jgi:integrase